MSETLSPRQSWEGPKINGDMRAKLSDALYSEFYSKAMSREDFDKKAGGMSDKQIADAAYQSFYDGKVDRAQFNETLGLKSHSGATADAITGGMSLGFQDELRAIAGTGVRTLGTLLTGKLPTWTAMSGAYDQELRAQRENADVFRQNNPYLGRGLEFAGGMLTGGGPGSVATQAPTRTGAALNAAKIGAVTGFGDAEGDLANRVEGMGVGAGLGGAIGAAAPVALQGVSMLLGRAGKMLGIGDSEKVATQLLLKAFQDDGIPPQQIATRLAEWQKAGAKPETLFDLGGENVRRLARTAAGRTGPGTERAVTFLEGRQSDQAQRVAEDVANTLGQKSSDFHPSMAALNETRRTSAAPLYEQAFAVTPTKVEADTVQRFIKDPIGQEALQKGLRIIELEHLAAGTKFDPKAYGVVREGATAPQAGRVSPGFSPGLPTVGTVPTPQPQPTSGKWVLQPGQEPNMRLMDAVKRGYDDIVESFRSPTTGRLQLDQYGRAVNDARAAYTGSLRSMFPKYGDALNAWAGPSQLMDAANRGRSIFTMRDSEVAASAVAVRTNPAEADAFRLGAAQAIRDQIARAPDGADAVKRIFGSPQKRELLRAAFPSEGAFKAFEAAMKREAAMYKNAQFVSPRTGSQTQLREADAGDIGSMATDVLGALATGAIMPGQTARGAVGQAFRNMGARAQGISPGVADSLVARLFTSDPKAIGRTGGLLSQTDLDNALARIQARRLGGLLMPGASAGVNVAR